MNEEIAYYKKLETAMWKTRGARFIAAADLSFKDRFSVITVSFLSVYLLVLSITQLTFPELFDSLATRFFGITSAACSCSLLVLSLLDYAYGRSIQAEKLQQSALQITVIMRSIERETASATPDMERIRALASEYEVEISRTHINHTTQDYEKFLRSRKTADNAITKFFVKFWVRLVDYFTMCISLSGHIFVILFVIGTSLWYIFSSPP